MSSRGSLVAAGIVFAALPLARAAVICTPSATAPPVRAESLTERVGDIVLSCTGNPGEVLAGNLSIFLPVNVTNRLSDNGTLDAVLSVQIGSATVVAPGATAMPLGNTGVSFNNVNVPLTTGQATLLITNLRGAIAQWNSTNPISALVSFSGSSSVPLTSASVVVGLPLRSLLAGANAGSINCFGSPLPDTITFSNLLAKGTRVFSNRVTEGYNSAFQKKAANADSGVRFIIRYQGFPSGARLFVPDAIAGSDTVQPTAGGDLPGLASGGSYQPSAGGSLVLARVAYASADGSAGAPVFVPGAPGSSAVTFDSVSELSLTGGAGYVVYEVMDANPNVRESAQIPTFLGLPPPASGSPGVANETMFLAPVSTDATASKGPIPRFAAVTPPPDCNGLGDCSAFPKLLVEPWTSYPLTFTAVAGGKRQSGFASVENLGGGNLAWSLSVSYQSGSGWIDNIYSEPNRGAYSGWFRVDVDPGPLQPGTYKATITVDAGWAAGSQSVPVTLTVTAPPPQTNPPPSTPPAAATPQVNAVVHAATFAAGPVVPGSLSTIMGAHLAGKNISVTFDGMPAKLLYSGDTQINLLVPAELAGRTTAQLVVIVDGAGSTPRAVDVAQISPAVFANGILNQDNFVNSPSNPAQVGSVVQIFATGLPAAAVGSISAKIHDREIPVPDYAGPAPGLPGVQQVNLTVPADLPAMTTEVVLCGTSLSSGQRVCSPGTKISLRQ